MNLKQLDGSVIPDRGVIIPAYTKINYHRVGRLYK